MYFCVEAMAKRGDGGDKPPIQLKIYSYNRKIPGPRRRQVPGETRRINVFGASICVLWDMVDYPTPPGEDHFSIYEKINSVFVNQGYRTGNMEIRVYGWDQNTISEEKQCASVGAGVYFVPKVPMGTDWRVNRMLRDILIWTLDHDSPSNLMVISKSILEDTATFLRVVRSLKSGGHNVFFVQPNNVSLELLRPFENFVWLWNTLLDGGNPIRQSQVGNTCACSYHI